MTAPDQYQPADDDETAMRQALRAGDQAEYLRLLARSMLLVPVSPVVAAGGAPLVWPTAEIEGRTSLLAYTSAAAMASSTGGAALTFRKVPFGELAAGWPNPEWWLAVNPGLPIESLLPATAVAALARGEVPESGRRPERGHAPGGPADTGPTIMQQTLPIDHLARYLRHDYPWVGGYVHRFADVAGLITPAQLMAGLGLAYDGSPFVATADAVLALRWPMVGSGLYRTPFGGPTEAAMRAMPGGWVIEGPPFSGTGFAAGDGPPIPEFKVESVPLPHGAELYRIDVTGRQVPIAVFDADRARWTATAASGMSIMRDPAAYGADSQRYQGPSGRIRDGFRAGWRGTEYEASSDGVTVRLYAAEATPGFERVIEGRYLRVVRPEELHAMAYEHTVCTWRDRPFKVLREQDGWFLLEYLGGQAPVAEALGLDRFDRGVYHGWARPADVMDVRTERVS